MAQIIVGDYRFTHNSVSLLGKGGFGYVYSGYHHIELTRNLNDHENILKFYTHEVSDRNFIYIVTELCDLSLRDFLDVKGKLSEESIKKFFIQIGNALVAVHSFRVIHRDLKPVNILLVNKSNKTLEHAGVDDFIIKVADFGLADSVDDKSILSASTICGTPMYMAPEVKKIDGHVNYSKKGDIWSTGIIMLECFLSKAEFNEIINLIKKLVEPYENDDNLIDYWFKSRTNRSESITTVFRSLLKVSLKFEPSSRVSAKQFRKHSFFEPRNNRNVIIVKPLDKKALISNRRLLSAAQENNIDLVRDLLEQCADPNIKDYDGNTALHLAAFNEDDNYLLVELLLEYGADIDSQNEDGKTCLMYAAAFNKIEIVQCLLQNGADINRKNKLSENVLHYAARNKNDNKFIIELLLENYADIDSQEEKGYTCLMTAARHNKIEIVRCLLQNGADPNIKDYNGNTALHLVAKNNANKFIIELLLEYGADINKQNSVGDTARKIAKAKEDNKEIVRLLLYYEKKSKPFFLTKIFKRMNGKK